MSELAGSVVSPGDVTVAGRCDLVLLLRGPGRKGTLVGSSEAPSLVLVQG